MKPCSLCKEIKPISEFYVSGGYLYPQCKLCKRNKDKSTYHKNASEKERRKRNDKKSRQIRRLRAQIFVYEILSKSKCVDCNESRFETLEFDHICGNKTKPISLMVKQGLKPEEIQKEISKCEVRCANCHRIRTSKQLEWARSNWSVENAKQMLAILTPK